MWAREKKKKNARGNASLEHCSKESEKKNICQATLCQISKRGNAKCGVQGKKKGVGFGNRKAESPRSKTKSAGICSLQNTVARSPCPARDAMRCEALESEEQKKKQKREKERRERKGSDKKKALKRWKRKRCSARHHGLLQVEKKKKKVGRRRSWRERGRQRRYDDQTFQTAVQREGEGGKALTS